VSRAIYRTVGIRLDRLRPPRPAWVDGTLSRSSRNSYWAQVNLSWIEFPNPQARPELT
jgi:hypothetical protein